MRGSGLGVGIPTPVPNPQSLLPCRFLDDADFGGGQAVEIIDEAGDLGHEADGFVQGDDDARHKGEGITSYELRITNYKRGNANERRSDEDTRQ